jgi:hypothetical protein
MDKERLPRKQIKRKDDFDDDFRAQLRNTVVDNRLSGDICTALQDDNRTPIIKNMRLRALVQRHNQVTYAFLCALNRMNLLDENDDITDGQTLERKLGGSRAGNGTRSQAKRWPQILLALFLLCILFLLPNVYYQYIYDINKVKLHKLNEHLAKNYAGQRPLNVTKANELREDFVHRAEEAREVIGRLGASHCEWSFVTESIVLIWTASTMNLFVLIPLSCRRNGWPVLAPRAILDPKYESQLWVRLILDELQRFAAMSASFARFQLVQLERDLTNALNDRCGGSGKSKDAQLKLLSRRALQTVASRLERRHQSNIEQLKTSALEGRLNPMGRTPATRDKLALFYLLSLWLTAIYLELIVLGSYHHLKTSFSSTGIFVEVNGPQDAVYFFFMAFLLHLHVISSINMGLSNMATLMDQFESSRRLHTLIKYVIRTNEQKFRHSIALTRQERSRVQNATHGGCRYPTSVSAETRPGIACTAAIDEIKLNVLMVSIQCRLAERVSELSRRPMNRVAHAGVLFAVLLLTIFRAHNPYYGEQLRSTSFRVSLACVICIFAYSVPLVIVHKQMVRTFSELWALVAQMSYFETFPDAKQHLKIDSMVGLFSMRRELADTRIRMKRFAYSVVGIAMTGSNLIRIAFWVAIIMLSLSDNKITFSMGLSEFFSDPFGLFEFTRSL